MYDLNDLNDIEVQSLIHSLKHPKNINSFSDAYENISSLVNRVNINEPIIDDNDIEYFLKVYQGRLDKDRFSIHLRFKEFHHHLVRIDVNPNINHNNPDGEKIVGSHIHIYTNEHMPRDLVAIPLSKSDFPNVKTLVDAFAEFISYNNIK